MQVGKICGRISTKHGYREIGIDFQLIRAHRLAFLYMTGQWPIDQVDHINNDKTDNRWCNLREANRSQNCANQGLKKNHGNQFIGVVWDKPRNKWRAQIRINGRKVNLGRFVNIEEAKAARNKAARETFGEFARLNNNVG